MKLKAIYNQLLQEAGGEEPGQIELRRVTVEDALAYCKKMGLNVPKLEIHLRLAQKLFDYGKTKRADMPVIDEKDVKDFQSKLKSGLLDLEDPFSDRTDPSDPFPQGLSGTSATDWMRNGLRDKKRPDDVIKVYEKRIAAKDLKPIQQQVYLDKSVKSTVKFGIEGTTSFLNNSTLICSSDGRIIDGHHRYLSALIIDPNMMMKCLVIDLPISKLLPLATAYGDARGNERNA